MHGRRRTLFLAITAMVLALCSPGVAVAGGGHHHGHGPVVVAKDLGGGSGSTIGPDGALYVTEPTKGQVTRIDLWTGHTKVVADCLAKRASGPPLGGAMDVAFLGHRMYVLTAYVAGEGTTGLYRVKSKHDCRLVADIGAYNTAHQPTGFDVAVKSGVPYAMERYHRAFLVTDGHLNRVLKVRVDGDVRTVLQLGNVVPTGLERIRSKVLLSLAGPVPHLPQDGKVVAFRVGSDRTHLVARGGRLLVDVEAGRHHLYALSQGVLPTGAMPGSPATPDTGRLLRVHDRGFDVVARGLDRPTSMEIVGRHAYVIGYEGVVWRVRLG